METRRYPMLAQFVNFACVGAIATALQYLVLIALVQFGDIGPVPASGVGYAAGAGINYLINYHYTFASQRSHFQAMLKFFTVAIIGLMLNSLIVAVATEKLLLHYLPAQVIATGLVLMWNFVANRVWTFGPART
jgi:putative flippase GtrA